MIIAVIATWSLFNVAFAGWLTWVRVIQPDRAKLRRVKRSRRFHLRTRVN
jgi:hypothetical protein